MTGTVDDFLTPFTPEVQDLVLKTRSLVLALIPDAIEIVDPPSRLIGYGFGRKYAELICAIMPYKTYVNLIFSQGVELPDPEGLLVGTGKHARHVKVMRPEDIQSPGLKKLIQSAGDALRH